MGIECLCYVDCPAAEPTIISGVTKLAHNDRLILGNTQAFRVVDPTDPFPTGYTVGDIWAS